MAAWLVAEVWLQQKTSLRQAFSFSKIAFDWDFELFKKIYSEVQTVPGFLNDSHHLLFRSEEVFKMVLDNVANKKAWSLCASKGRAHLHRFPVCSWTLHSFKAYLSQLLLR